MIIIKKDGVVYFCESYYNAFYLATHADFINHEENRHIIRDTSRAHRLTLIDAPGRATDLLRYSDIFPARLTPQSLLRQTYPKLVSIFEPFGFSNDKDVPFDIAFAKGDKCYVMRRGGVIDELEEFYPLCLARDAAVGEYIRKKDEPIYRLVQSIYREIESCSSKIQFPVVVMNTRDEKVRVVTREEEL
jgi:hypothetical protein